MAIDIGIFGIDTDANLISLTNKSSSFIGHTAFGYLIPNDGKLAGIGIEDVIKKVIRIW
jgi:hypothetical protein